MNNNNVTIIICCTGMRTRLDINSSKALININDESIIIKLLKNFEKFDDIRIVVGYQAEKIIATVNEYRKDIIFTFNYDYKNNGSSASILNSLKYCNENIIILDGDLVIKPGDINNILYSKEECIAYTKKISDEPILIDVNEKEHKAISLNVKNSLYEWPGIVKIKKNRLKNRKDYIYNLINDILPLNAFYINAMKIDVQEDYDRVIRWQKNNYSIKEEKNEKK